MTRYEYVIKHKRGNYVPAEVSGGKYGRTTLPRARRFKTYREARAFCAALNWKVEEYMPKPRDGRWATKRVPPFAVKPVLVSD